VLGFAEYGSPAGVPVMYFTGGNNSRLEAALLDSTALELDARIIATDRPGFGMSTFQPGRSLLDWPDDVRELADSLGLDRFHVLGYSGGGPHALATGYRLRNRVLGTAIVAGAAPPHTPGTRKGMWPPIRVLYALARWAPLPVLASIQKAMTDPSRNFTDANIRRMRPADRESLSTMPQALAAVTASMNEAHRAGYEGAAWEWRLYTRPWGFSLDSVPGHIELWYGEQDGNAPPAMGRYLANALPDARLTDEAHLSLMIRRGGDMLRRLVEG
jgi:pimeloyl-ACP methyl ester carboxylesterase